jgi:hypothetical protein
LLPPLLLAEKVRAPHDENGINRANVTIIAGDRETGALSNDFRSIVISTPSLLYAIAQERISAQL